MSHGLRLSLRPETGEFLLGHGVDQYNYLQINQAPDVVLDEWRKFTEYIDKGVDAQTLGEVHKLREENEDLRARLERLEAISVERLVLAAANTKPTSQKKRKNTRPNWKPSQSRE